jgi:hypothetical protein
MTCTVNTARNSFHGCTLHAAGLSSYCTRQHPCTVLAAAHHIHTRPPDIPARLAYQRHLVNTYRTSDLRRPRARQGDHRHDHRRALALTRSGTGVDIRGVVRDMSDDERGRDRASSSPAARGGIGSHAHQSEARREDRDSSRAWRAGNFPAPALYSTAGSSATRTFLATSGTSSRPSASSTAGF